MEEEKQMPNAEEQRKYVFIHLHLFKIIFKHLFKYFD